VRKLKFAILFLHHNIVALVLGSINILHPVSNAEVSRQYLIFYGIISKHYFVIITCYNNVIHTKIMNS